MSLDALVVGGGLAGATAAAELARAGRSVVLLERTVTAHDKVCGEFLSREALHYLSRSGVDLEALGAVPITALRVVLGEVLAETALPFRALSLRRRVLDQALLAHAEQAGCEVRRRVQVQSLERRGTEFVARLGEGESASAKTVFLATGKHDLHGQSPRVGWHGELVAFKMYFRLVPAQQQALASHVELILFPGGYAGLQPVDDGLANLCLLVTREQLQRSGSGWPGLLAHMCEHSPHLARRLESAQPVLERPLALSSIPYGFLRRRAEPHLWALGDQSAVIPSFSGDGMSIALHSAHLAAAMYLAGHSPAQFVRRLRGDLRSGMTLATCLSQVLVRLPAAASLSRLSPGLLRGIVSATRIPAGSLLG